MKFVRERFSDKGIALIFLIVLIIVLISILAITLKSIFDFESVGATVEENISLEEVIRKIYRIYTRRRCVFDFKR